MRWKACVVVGNESTTTLKKCFDSLRTIGFTDGIHVICAREVSIPNAPDVSRQRIASRSDAVKWSTAIDVVSRAYSTTEDVFLFVTPQIRLWRHTRPFLNATLEPDFVSLYFPYSPDRFYVDREWDSPPCDSDLAGWCQTPMVEPSSASEALIMHRHTARLMASYLRDVEDMPGIPVWSEVLAETIRRHKIISYVSTPSFASHASGVSVNFVEQYKQGVLDPSVNRYLN